jgi:hypothetical protein
VPDDGDRAARRVDDAVAHRPEGRAPPRCRGRGSPRRPAFGGDQLGGDDDSASVERIPADVFVTRAEAAAAKGAAVLVVLRHRSAADPTVVRIQEP